MQIVAVGTDGEVRGYSPPDAEQVDLQLDHSVQEAQLQALYDKKNVSCWDGTRAFPALLHPSASVRLRCAVLKCGACRCDGASRDCHWSCVHRFPSEGGTAHRTAPHVALVAHLCTHSSSFSFFNSCTPRAPDHRNC